MYLRAQAFLLYSCTVPHYLFFPMLTANLKQLLCKTNGKKRLTLVSDQTRSLRGSPDL